MKFILPVNEEIHPEAVWFRGKDRFDQIFSNSLLFWPTGLISRIGRAGVQVPSLSVIGRKFVTHGKRLERPPTGNLMEDSNLPGRLGLEFASAPMARRLPVSDYAWAIVIPRESDEGGSQNQASLERQ